MMSTVYIKGNYQHARDWYSLKKKLLYQPTYKQSSSAWSAKATQPSTRLLYRQNFSGGLNTRMQYKEYATAVYAYHANFPVRILNLICLCRNKIAYPHYVHQTKKLKWTSLDQSRNRTVKKANENKHNWKIKQSS